MTSKWQRKWFSQESIAREEEFTAVARRVLFVLMYQLFICIGGVYAIFVCVEESQTKLRRPAGMAMNEWFFAG